MNWLLNKIFGRKLHRQTAQYIRGLQQSTVKASRRKATEVLEKLGTSTDAVALGKMAWGKPVRVPFDHMLKAHSLITGGTGSGKTSFALGIVKSILNKLRNDSRLGFGLIDPKGDLYVGTLFLLAELLKELNQSDPATAKELRRRVVICDLASPDPVTPYNLLSRPSDIDADFFVFNRSEILLDLLAGTDKLSLGGTAVLQKILHLLSASNLPITYADEALSDSTILNRLIAQCNDPLVKSYFARQFPDVPSVTIAALQRRLNALFASTSVRLALSGNTAPDFRRYMDEGKIVLVNCFSQSISRDVRRVLQSLVLSDIRQAIFSRKQPNTTFTWLADEAQNLFLTESQCDSMADLLRMSRSFGSFFCLLTQNIATAVQDARMLSTVYTNIRWSFSMRGEPSDCSFLKPALPVTGRRPRPKRDPFAEPTFCSITEERGLVLDEISSLPDRTGWLWLRSETPEAILMRTADVWMPSGRELANAVAPLKRDPTFGSRMSRKIYDRMIADRDSHWKEPSESLAGTDDEFATAYERRRRRNGSSK